jgi:hypothetical protein
MRWASPVLRRLGNKAREMKRRGRCRPVLEVLETRLAPALINWVNRADFDDEYQGNTMTARQVIDRAILQWETTIDSFNYRNVGQDGWAPANRFDLTINVADLGDSLGRLTTIEPETDLDGDGKPFNGMITMDDDAKTANPDDKEGWYFDPNAGEDFEYKSPLTPWAAAGGPDGFDFYSVMLHEIGHALGFRYTANSNIQGRITNSAAPPPEKVFHFLDGSTVLMTLEGGLHLWDGTHANDLMSPSLPSGHRNTISDLDARILADAYGYTINWGVIPQRSFVTTFDPATGKLFLWGDLGTTYETGRLFDDIKLDVFTGGLIFADVNGYVKQISQSAVSSIQVEAKELNDQIRIGGTAAGQTVFVFGGRGDNTVFLSHNAKNLDTIQGNVHAEETGGKTTVTLHDENATAGRTFTAFGSVKFGGSNAEILYDYVDVAHDLNFVIIRGGAHGNTYRLSNPTVTTSFRIDAGAGADTVNISSTFGGVTVEGGGGLDTVTVGADFLSGMRDVKGLVYVSNVAPFTNLLLNDFGDPNPNPNIQVTDTNVTGLGPAEILFDKGELASLTIETGSNNDFVSVGNSVPRNLRLVDASSFDVDTLRLFNATATYTPDSSNQPDRGTLNVGVNNTIQFTGFEFVTPVAPDITSFGPDRSVINEGDSVTLNHQFIDSGSLSSHSVTIVWGDGSTDQFNLPVGTRSFTRTRQYLDDDPTGTPQDLYPVQITITDNDNLTDAASTQVTVNNVAPVLTGFGISSSGGDKVREGDVITLSGNFTDIGTNDTHTALVDWNDGSPVTPVQITGAGGSWSLRAEHVFASAGIYTVRVTLRDDDTGGIVASKALFITGVGVQRLNGRLTLIVVGSNSDDELTINRQGNGQFRVDASFLPEGNRLISAAGIELIEVVLSDGNDRAAIASNVTLPAVMDGGDGDDHLNGGNGTNILIGGRHNDFLIGGNTRDILIGGLGADRLVGNGGNDILIGGYTSYDSAADENKLDNDAALLKLLEEWNSGRLYDERVANLRNGSGPILAGSGLSLRKGTTVFDDSDIDQLTGSPGSDWFLFDPSKDILTDRIDGELTN